MTEKEKVIYEIQQYLRNISKSRNDDSAIIPDGIYSAETADAVREFQRIMGLETSGRVDYPTFYALVKENQRGISENELPVQVMPIKNENLPLYYGMENEFVEKLRIMLDFAADKHRNLIPVGRGSNFDRNTEDAVRLWQKVVFAEENGVVDKYTWNTLAEYYLL